MSCLYEMFNDVKGYRNTEAFSEVQDPYYVIPCVLYLLYLVLSRIAKMGGSTTIVANRQALMPMMATYPILLSPG